MLLAFAISHRNLAQSSDLAIPIMGIGCKPPPLAMVVDISYDDLPPPM